jgi:hypothetical protein
MMNNESKVIFVSDEARAILERRGVAFDEAFVKRPGVTVVKAAPTKSTLSAVEQLREHLAARPKGFQDGDAEFQHRELQLRNQIAAEFWSPTPAAKGARP